MKTCTIIIILSIFSVFGSAQSTDTPYTLGNKLFTGAHPLTDSTACINCHVLIEPDTVNWNPSAYDISILFADTTPEAFEEAVMYPLSDKMWESHEGYEFNADELLALQTFLKHIKANGKVEKPLQKKESLIYWICFLLFLLVLSDYLFFRKINYKTLYLVVLVCTLMLSVYGATVRVQQLKLNAGYQPVQPIKFSHQVHCTVNNIECNYCHHSLYQSKNAGIPGSNQCMNCHGVIMAGTRSGEHELRKIIPAGNIKKNIEWIRIAHLPQHVKFDHSVHTKTVECEQCHGDVAQMHRTRQVHPFAMDWCLDCHKDSKVLLANNKYYTALLISEIGIRHDSITVKDLNGWECLSCHY